MPSQPKFKWIAALAAAAALLALPAAAQATLAFTRNPLHPVVFAANDNGSDAAQGRPRAQPPGLARRAVDRLPATKARVTPRN